MSNSILIQFFLINKPIIKITIYYSYSPSHFNSLPSPTLLVFPLGLQQAVWINDVRLDTCDPICALITTIFTSMVDRHSCMGYLLLSICFRASIWVKETPMVLSFSLLLAYKHSRSNPIFGHTQLPWSLWLLNIER